MGTLARLGLQALTIYPGSPLAFSELWANVGGTFIMGFLSEDRLLPQREWKDAISKARPRGQQEEYRRKIGEARKLAAAVENHRVTKKTIPVHWTLGRLLRLFHFLLVLHPGHFSHLV